LLRQSGASKVIELFLIFGIFDSEALTYFEILLKPALSFFIFFFQLSVYLLTHFSFLVLSFILTTPLASFTKSVILPHLFRKLS